jgi:hypothetical protein
LCSFQLTVNVSGHRQETLNEEEVMRDLAEVCIQAEEAFFRNHCSKAHPTEAEAVLHHISAVEKLAQVRSSRKRVLTGQIEES